jgi:hypothetical protein
LTVDVLLLPSGIRIAFFGGTDLTLKDARSKLVNFTCKKKQFLNGFSRLREKLAPRRKNGTGTTIV